MIQLTDSLYYNEELPFDQQPDDVKEFIAQHYYGSCKLLPPPDFEGNRLEHENGYTLFDEFVRPVEACVKLGNLSIIGHRYYVDGSTAWKLHSEEITVKIDEP